MQKYFDVFLEFDYEKLEGIIKERSLSGKGYCCFVDSTLLVESHCDPQIKNILNNALVNSCDGSYIALFASGIYHTRFTAHNGPELFKKFIQYSDKQCIVGNTPEVFLKIREKVKQGGGSGENLHFISLPFLNADQFDYKLIAEEIKSINPRYIWVSLGVPKQELFMSALLPCIDKGVILGVGAALNYFSGEIKDIPSWASKFNLIWLHRILTEPKNRFVEFSGFSEIILRYI